MADEISAKDLWVKSVLGVDVAASESWVGRTWHQGIKAVGEFDDRHGQILTRTAGVVQALGGGAEAVTGVTVATAGGAATATGIGAAPGIPAMVGGGLLAANGLDNVQAGLRTAWTGKGTHTLGADAAGATARGLGASKETADRISDGMDVAQGLVGGAATAGAALARRMAGRELKVAADVVQAERAAVAKLKPCMPQDIPPHERAKMRTPDNEGAQAVTDELAALRDRPPDDPGRVAAVVKFARASTHMEPPPDRVVLGAWAETGKGGYTDKAKELGGIWYETPEGSFDSVGATAAWDSNAVFLRQMMAAGIKRFDFESVDISDILPKLGRVARYTARGTKGAKLQSRVKEAELLLKEGPQYGYKLVGNSFVKVR